MTMKLKAFVLWIELGALAASGGAQIAQQGAAPAGLARQLPVEPPPPVASARQQGSPFLGSVPAGKATAAVLPLSLADAIHRGLQHNLGLVLSRQSAQTALGQRYQAASALLPNININAAGVEEQVNLQAFGFSGFPGLPAVVGPFSVADARAYLTQQVLNLNALYNARSASHHFKAAQYSYQDSRDIVVLNVTGLYLQAIAGSARIATAQAQFHTAQALYNQAVDQKKAGVVAGIDVIRAEVQLEAQRQQLIFYQNQFEIQKLDLARAIGLPLEQQFTLASQVPYAPQDPIPYEQALGEAYRYRADYQQALALVRAAEESRRAAAAGHYPSISADGNYGAIGPSFTNSHGAFFLSGTLSVPLFQGGRIHGDVIQAEALLRQRIAEKEDLRSRIEYELRTAFLNLQSYGDQVKVAQSNLDLANQQLMQSRDRYAAGVTDNIEVVQSQQAVAAANENYISALYSYNLAKASLARAIGGAEKTLSRFLGVAP
jgi:outer membrane protein TolC